MMNSRANWDKQRERHGTGESKAPIHPPAFMIGMFVYTYINFLLLFKKKKKASCLFYLKKEIHLRFSLQYRTGSITFYPSERRVSPLFHPSQFGHAGNQLRHRRRGQHPAADHPGQQPLIKKLQTQSQSRTNFSAALIAERHRKQAYRQKKNKKQLWSCCSACSWAP